MSIITETPSKIEYKTKRGKLHRMDGPAIIYKNKDKFEWYRNGKKHRLDGPAVKRYNTYEWFRKGKKHRIGGPAVYDIVDGKVIFEQYWIMGERYHSELEYKMEIRKVRINKILEEDKKEV